ncbi:transcriptional regulator [Virgibacillus sp. MSJ-26]|uniref:transcriptional regulator n=1 Tax=Virgibacillus sp. MSJ-26 TaxID=2841522 RepID=UPI00209E9F9F|nr:transcriptional regulator [Virgibacillus sp. MSJ-26]
MILEKAIKYNQLINMVYMSKEGQITKRKIKVLNLEKDQLNAFCFLRQAKRTFNINNILALQPIYTKRNMVI